MKTIKIKGVLILDKDGSYVLHGDNEKTSTDMFKLLTDGPLPLWHFDPTGDAAHAVEFELTIPELENIWMTLTSLAELQQQLAIEQSVLDDEVVRQPVLFYTISEALTDALALRDGAKEELASIDAEMDSIGRKQLSKNDAKVTEKMVQNYVQCSHQHEKAFDAYLKAKTYADKLLALKEAFQQRSYMLRDLVSLYSANYYETSSIKPTQATEASHYNANRMRMSNARAARAK